MRSASVDLPWSMCAMMEKFRMYFGWAAMRGGPKSERRVYAISDQKATAGRADAPCILEDQLDALADVLRHRHLGLGVEQLERRVLLGRDVDGGRDLLPTHRS